MAVSERNKKPNSEQELTSIIELCQKLLKNLEQIKEAYNKQLPINHVETEYEKIIDDLVNRVTRLEKQFKAFKEYREYVSQYELNDAMKAEKNKKIEEEILEREKMLEKIEHEYKEYQNKKEMQNEIDRIKSRRIEIQKEIDSLIKQKNEKVKELYKICEEMREIAAEMVINVDEVYVVIVGEENNKRQIAFPMREAQEKIRLIDYSEWKDEDQQAGQLLIKQGLINCTKEKLSELGYIITAEDELHIENQAKAKAKEIVSHKDNANRIGKFNIAASRRIEISDGMAQLDSQVATLRGEDDQLRSMLESTIIIASELEPAAEQWHDKLPHLSVSDKKDTVEEKVDVGSHDKATPSVATPSKETQSAEEAGTPKVPHESSGSTHKEQHHSTHAAILTSLKSKPAVLQPIIENKSLPTETVNPPVVTAPEAEAQIQPVTEALAQPAAPAKTETIDASHMDKEKAPEPSKSAAQVDVIKTRRVGAAAFRSQLAVKKATKDKEDKGDKLDKEGTIHSPKPR